jgi:hypothetical protein
MSPGHGTRLYEHMFVQSPSMLYLRRRDTGPAAHGGPTSSAMRAGRPGIVRELMRGPSVACDPTEAEQALAWARAHPAWIEDPAPLYAHDPNAA